MVTKKPKYRRASLLVNTPPEPTPDEHVVQLNVILDAKKAFRLALHLLSVYESGDDPIAISFDKGTFYFKDEHYEKVDVSTEKLRMTIGNLGTAE